MDRAAWRALRIAERLEAEAEREVARPGSRGGGRSVFSSDPHQGPPPR